MLHAKSGGTRWESRTFLRDDKPSQSHTSTGMLGKQTGCLGEMQRGRWGWDMSEQGGREASNEKKKIVTSLDQ